MAKKTSASKLIDKAESFPWEKWSKEMRDLYEPLYTDGTKIGAVVSLGDVEFETGDPFVSEFMTDYVGERIKQLQGTTKDRVIELIRRELDAGGTSQGDLGTKVLNVIREQFDGYKQWRANLIARTETGFAYNHGTVLGAHQAGFDLVDVTDGDSDPECRAANGSVWTIQRALNNPLEHPNCVRAFGPHVE